VVESVAGTTILGVHILFIRKRRTPQASRIRSVSIFGLGTAGALLLLSLPLHSCSLGGSSFLPYDGTSAFSGSSDASSQSVSVASTTKHGGAALASIGTVVSGSSVAAQPKSLPTREHPATILIPAHGAGWSPAVLLPRANAGGIAYALCRRATLGNDTLLVQYRKDTGGWQNFVPGASGSEERYQSATYAQTVIFFFIPTEEDCETAL
jgi:hypothetical protein